MADLIADLDRFRLGLRLKQMLHDRGINTEELMQSSKYGITVFCQSYSPGVRAAVNGIILPADMRDLPDYLVAIPGVMVCSEDLRTTAPLMDTILPIWARYVVFWSFLPDIDPPTAENGEE